MKAEKGVLIFSPEKLTPKLILMRSLLPVVLIILLLIAQSCKKDATPGTTPRTGLDALVSANATNYCVFIVGAYHNGVVEGSDTVVMQNTAGDTISHFSGESQSFFGMYDIVGGKYFCVNPNSPYRNIQFQFQRVSNFLGVDHNCSLTDTLAYMGYEHLTSGAGDPKPGVYLYLFNRNGTSAGSDRNTDSLAFQVTSATDISTPTGCHLVRVKGKFNNVNFYNSICGPVPQFTVYQAEFQMDFYNE